MKITRELLTDWNACTKGYNWFTSHFPTGEGEYQEVLDALAIENQPQYANWLMNSAGFDESILEIDEITDRKHLFFAGSVVVKKGISVSGWLCAGGGITAGEGIEAGGGIKAGGGITAGEGIKAGGGIKAGEGIEAGWEITAGGGITAGWEITAGEGIEAGEDIKAGDDFGVFAGLRVVISDWPCYAKVIAQSKPKNLISGAWIEPEEK